MSRRSLPLRARGYLAGALALRHAVAAVDAAWTGVWLGLLRRDDLHAVDGAYYDALATYRDDAHNRRGLFPWEARALAEHFPPRGRLLVVGAGGGREVLALAAAGYEIEGFECNPGLVEVAARVLADAGAAARVRHLARDRAPDGAGGPFDGAVVGWSAYMLIAGRRHRVAFLRGLRAQLRDGAPVLLSFFTRDGDSRRQRAVHAVARALRRLRGDDPPEVGDDLAPNFVHRFTEAEIRAELAEAGFALAAYEPEGAGPFESGNAVGVASAPVAPAAVAAAVVAAAAAPAAPSPIPLGHPR